MGGNGWLGVDFKTFLWVHFREMHLAETKDIFSFCAFHGNAPTGFARFCNWLNGREGTSPA